MATSYSVGARGWFQYDGSETNIAEIGTFGWFDEATTDIFREGISFSSSSTTSTVLQSGLKRSISFSSKRKSMIVIQTRVT